MGSLFTDCSTWKESASNAQTPVEVCLAGSVSDGRFVHTGKELEEMIDKDRCGDVVPRDVVDFITPKRSDFEKWLDQYLLFYVHVLPRGRANFSAKDNVHSFLKWKAMGWICPPDSLPTEATKRSMSMFSAYHGNWGEFAKKIKAEKNGKGQLTFPTKLKLNGENADLEHGHYQVEGYSNVWAVTFHGYCPHGFNVAVNSAARSLYRVLLLDDELNRDEECDELTNELCALEAENSAVTAHVTGHKRKEPTKSVEVHDLTYPDAVYDLTYPTNFYDLTSSP